MAACEVRRKISLGRRWGGWLRCCVGASRTGTLCFFSLEDAGRDTVSSDREKRHGAEASDAADRNSFPARKVSKRSELLLIFP